MTLTATYNSDLSRVQLAATGLDDPPATAVTATVERSRNQVLWETVRGGLAATVTGGAAALDDYEFYPNVTTYYRVTSYDSDDNQLQQHTTSLTVDLDSVWLKSLRYPFLNRPVLVQNWEPVTRRARSQVLHVQGRSVPVAVHDLHTSHEFTLQVATGDLVDPTVDGLTEARDLDLMLAASTTLLVHVPATWQVPGGYVTVGDVSTDRVVRHGNSPFVFTLPCTVVAPPGPDVVGGTMTWAAVKRVYGSWTSTVAANPTWADVVAQIADEEDLVVL